MNHGRPSLKSKFATVYEAILQGEIVENHVWDEIFLLKVNVSFLEESFSKLKSEQLVKIKESINNLFVRCVDGLSQEHNIKSLNILITLSTLVRCVWRPDLGEGFRAVDVLIGFDQADTVIQKLMDCLHRLLTSNSTPYDLKFYSIQFIKILCTASDNISQNTTVEYLMLYNMWQSLCRIVITPNLRLSLGPQALSLLALLLNYRKHEYNNPYIIKLMSLDDQLVLNGFGEIMLAYVGDYNSRLLSVKGQSYTEVVTSWIYWTYPSQELECATKPEVVLPLLLCLYELIHLNRSFITVLTQTMSSAQSVNNEQAHGNLLSSFLTFSSLIFSDIKDNTRASELCFDILLCVTEDQYAHAFMHDDNQVFPVFIYRTKLRHRKDVKQTTAAMPLVHTLLDLLSEFIMTHLTKQMPINLYSKCFRVLHRVLCYQKRARIRLLYPWTTLWSSIIAAIKWSSSLNVEMNSPEVLTPYIQVCTLFNMFVMYGDTFLPNPSSYDELYYELLRQHSVFDAAYSMAIKSANKGPGWKEASNELINSLHNIKAIMNHFSPRIEAWSSANKISTPTPEEVMEIVRSNYDSLTLKLQDGLDHYERYNEVPKEQQFFTNLIRYICIEERGKVSLQLDKEVYARCTSIE